MKHLIAAAKELNNVLGIDPAIEVNSKKTDVETLEEKIKEAAELIEPETDEISVTTQQVLSELGVNPWDEEQDDADEAPEDASEDDEEEDEEKPKKKGAAKKPEKVLAKNETATKGVPGKSIVVTEAIAFAERHISKGKYTQKELVEMMVDATGVKKTTAQTLLTDGRNPKYNRFSKLVKKAEDGKLSF